MEQVHEMAWYFLFMESFRSSVVSLSLPMLEEEEWARFTIGILRRCQIKVQFECRAKTKFLVAFEPFGRIFCMISYSMHLIYLNL